MFELKFFNFTCDCRYFFIADFSFSGYLPLLTSSNKTVI